tara:strand:- start:16 stop:1455 length:1440 start_codon:yes stop_codon:yes gene_type:complete
MPFAIGANQLDTGYEVSNSIRMAGTANFSDYTFGTSTNVRKRTINFWVKRSKINDSAGQVVFRCEEPDGSGGSLLFQGAGSGVGINDQLFISNRNATSGSSDYGVRTNRLFRDVSAWYNIHIEYDTTQSTASNRIKIYVNGVEETNLAQTDYPSQNYDTTSFLGGSTRTHEIGRGAPTGSVNNFKGYFANFAFVDGTALDPTSFGKFDDNGVWIPIDPLQQSINFGNVGFFLEFKQSGSNQNASGQGADTSGNDNHLNPNNMGTEDTTTDTPTNNFCTLNSVDNDGVVLSNGNCDFDTSGGSDEGVRGTIGVLRGKWYYECKITNSAGLSAGNVGYSQSPMRLTDNPRGGQCVVINGSLSVNLYNFSSSTVVLDASSGIGQNDIVGVALNLDDNEITFFKNNSQIGSTQSIASGLLQGDFFLPCMFDDGGVNDVVGSFNFGQPTFSGTDQSDAEGHGSFEYAPPSGYFALCTKNLAEYG